MYSLSCFIKKKKKVFIGVIGSSQTYHKQIFGIISKKLIIDSQLNLGTKRVNPILLKVDMKSAESVDLNTVNISNVISIVYFRNIKETIFLSAYK